MPELTQDNSLQLYIASSAAPGGRCAWAALAVEGGAIVEKRSGTLSPGTSWSAQIRAAVEGLAGMPDGARVEIVATAWFVECVNDFFPRWKAKGWRKSEKRPVRHAELWKELDTEMQRLRVVVRGFNTRDDEHFQGLALDLARETLGLVSAGDGTAIDISSQRVYRRSAPVGVTE